MLLVAGYPERHSFRWTVNGEPVSEGTANCYVQSTNATTGAREFLQGDGATWAPSKVLFPLTFNPITGTWDRSVSTPTSATERIVEVVGEHDGLDDIILPRIVLSYYVQGTTTDDLSGAEGALSQDIRFKGP